MSESKSGDLNRMDAITSTAVMPCVGGFIFYIGQNRGEDRLAVENQNASAIVMVRDARDLDR